MGGFRIICLLVCLLTVSLLSVVESYNVQKGDASNLLYIRARLNNESRRLQSRPANFRKTNRRQILSGLTAVISQVEESPREKFLAFAKEKRITHHTLLDRVEVGVYLTLWYFFSAVYNIYNKRALNCLGLPWFVATVQMGTGLLLFTPLWLLKLREFPTSNFSELLEVFGYMKSVALYQTLTHISGVIALGSGVVSFTQVIKASEPVFTAGISAIFLKQFLPWQVYTTLIPICIGVAVASTTELTFSWYCLLAGITANIFAAARGVFGKTQMCGDTSCLEQLSPENYYAILTILSFTMLMPAMAFIEGSQILTVLKGAYAYMKNSGGFVASLIQQPQLSALYSRNHFQGLLYSLYSGILFYLYNEVSFKALNKVHPVTHAVSNTVKRIVIILSSVIVFNNKMTPSGIFGTTLAISGVFLYSITQHLYKDKPQVAKAPLTISKWASI
jgi:solute carrier family 35, member E1